MNASSATTDTFSETEKVRRIRSAIRSAEAALLERWPLLNRRDLLGSLLLTVSAAGMILSGWLYWQGALPWWACLLLNAFLASILHEIEHDLIHFLYFRHRPLLHNSMLLIVWALRANIVHGWFRRRIHFLHHRTSGSLHDLEERLVGLGLPWNWKRLLVTLDGTASYYLNAPQLEREIPGFKRSQLYYASLPFYPLFVASLAGFILLHGLSWTLHGLGVGPLPLLTLLLSVFDLLCVAWVFPNMLRQASLQLVSSNVHYYGDVENLNQQTQVLSPLWMLPLQLFCFNFGATHILHHYVVQQPFYLRQLVAPRVYPTLRQCGIRFDDAGTFWRANRYEMASTGHSDLTASE